VQNSAKNKFSAVDKHPENIKEGIDSHWATCSVRMCDWLPFKRQQFTDISTWRPSY